jgi:hypothetical protein
MNIQPAFIFALVGAFALTGCGGGDDTISRGDRNRLAAACTVNTSTNEAACDCVADLARDELSPAAFAMVLASVEGDDARANELGGQLTIDEATQVGSFMFSSFARCASADAGGTRSK